MRVHSYSSALLPLLLVAGAGPLIAQSDLKVPAGTSVTVNESASYQNVTVGSGATLETIDANSGGAGDHAITITFAAGRAGTIQNNGLIEFAGNDQGNTTVFAHPVTLSGSGTLELLNTYGFNDASVQGPGTVTQAAGHTLIGGGGDTGASGPSFSAPLVNAGLVTTSNLGFVLNGTSLVNTGTFSASNGAVLYLDAPTLDNTNGTITVADANSRVRFENGIQVTGGTLVSAAQPGPTSTGYVVLAAGATLANLTLTANSGLNVADTGALAGTITNNGLINVPGSEFYSTLNLSGDVTLTGSGTLLLGGHLEGPNGATLTIDTTQTLIGSGDSPADGFGRDDVDANLVNNGMVIGDYQDFYINSPSFVNNGSVTATNGTSVYVGGSTLDNTKGTVTVDDANSVVLFQNGTQVTGGTLQSTLPATIGNNDGVYRLAGGATLTNLAIAANAGVNVADTGNLAGTITNNGYLYVPGSEFYSTLNLSGNVTLTGSGVLYLGGHLEGPNNATLTIDVNQSLLGSGDSPADGFGRDDVDANLVNNGTVASNYLDFYINSPSFVNNGTLAVRNNTNLVISSSAGFTNFNAGSTSARRVAPESRLASARSKKQDAGGGTLTGGTYTVTDTGNGATLDFGGRSVAVNAAAITLSGPNANFSAINSLTDNQGSLSLLAQIAFTTVSSLTNEGTIALDAGSTLHVNGNFTSSNTAALKITVGGTASQGAGSSGVLQASGAVALGGTLAVTLAPGAVLPDASDSMSFLSAGAGITGSFSNVPSGTRVATTDGRGSFVINYGANSNVLTVSNFAASGTSTTPAFFTGETALSNGVYYLAFPSGNDFGYYSFLPNPSYIYHFDLGYEYVFDAADGKSGVYFYDFASSDFFYTSPSFPFPYLYDFGLNTVLYYYPDPNNPGHYNTNGIRYFYDFASGTIITK